MNRFVIAEAAKCIGCRTCEIACALAHAPATGASPLSPENFSPRLTMVRAENVTTAVMCRQCEDAPCARACPAGAIEQAGDHVRVIQARCIGCKSCVVACPYGAMRVTTVAPVAQPGKFASRRPAAQALKCDVCSDRAQGPACVSACPTHAIHLMDDAAIAAMRQHRLEQAAQAPL